jgi:aminoglycoside phosphotransferase (APT) family kinase protein
VQDALVPVALVHADVRWENVILGGEKDEPSLVDWEDAGRGAPAWDLGCLFASFASFAIRAEVRFGTGPGAETLEAMMRAQVSGAWCGYSAGSNHARDRSFLHAAIRCAGVRLAEAAFAPAIAAPSELEVAALVDAATEMLDDPSRAAARWYGLDDSMA